MQRVARTTRTTSTRNFIVLHKHNCKVLAVIKSKLTSERARRRFGMTTSTLVNGFPHIFLIDISV